MILQFKPYNHKYIKRLLLIIETISDSKKATKNNFDNRKFISPTGLILPSDSALQALTWYSNLTESSNSNNK